MAGSPRATSAVAASRFLVVLISRLLCCRRSFLLSGLCRARIGPSFLDSGMRGKGRAILRAGDQFHLISFGETGRGQIVERLEHDRRAVRQFKKVADELAHIEPRGEAGGEASIERA